MPSATTATTATRVRLHHGPIDCAVHAEGDAAAVEAAIAAARRRFDGLLEALVRELPLLRADLSAPGAAAAPPPLGPVARRMVAACRPHAANGRFMTAMAAVAGSVAEELVGCFDRPGIARAWVNNGGDIALHLAPGTRVAVGTVADLPLAFAGHAPEGRFVVDAASPVRGVATSGWRGRSFSLGIADAVTVLARTASQADAAAAIVANAVDLPDHLAITRRAANDIQPDNDLGARLVTRYVGDLSRPDIVSALESGLRCARDLLAAGLIEAAALHLQGETRSIGLSRAKPTMETIPRGVGSRLERRACA